MPCSAWLFSGLLLVSCWPVAADILYSVTDLGSLGGTAYYTRGYGINNAGQATGYTGNAFGCCHPFLYTNGQMQDLGSLGGSGFGFGVNDLGEVTGESRVPSGPGHVFVYNDGHMTDIVPPNTNFSRGYSINDAGQVTGFISVPGFDGAFLYSGGQIIPLDTLGAPAYLGGSGYGINNAGQVTGFGYTSDRLPHAFLYSNGQMEDLGTLSGTSGSSYGYAINDAGEITGTSNSHVFLYRDGRMSDLGTLGSFSEGRAINNVGEIVGDFRSTSNVIFPYEAAFVYRDGRMYDLNDLIDPALGLTLNEATAINDRGQIVVNELINSTASRSFLLTPVPEPGTLVLFLIAVSSLAASLRHTWPASY